MTSKPVYCLLIEPDNHLAANLQESLHKYLGHPEIHVVTIAEAKEAIDLLSHALHFDIAVIPLPLAQDVMDIFVQWLPRTLIIALKEPSAPSFPHAMRPQIWDWLHRPIDMQQFASIAQRAGQELKHHGIVSDISAGQIALLLEQKLALSSWLEPMLEPALHLTGSKAAMLLLGLQGKTWRAAIYRNMSAEVAQTIADKVMQQMFSWQGMENSGQPVSCLLPQADGSEVLVTLFAENGSWLGLLALQLGDLPIQERMGLWNIFCAQLMPAIQLAASISKTLKSDEEVSQALAKAQQELVQTIKLASIGELAAGIAHDINTPLTCIVGFIRLFLRFLDRPNITSGELISIRHYLDKACQEVERCQEIITNLLLFARKESKTFQPFSISDVIQRAYTLLQEQLHQHKVEFSQDIPSNLPLVIGNANQIQQVLINLMVNAKNAMPQGGKLHIRIAALTEKVLIEVSDTGIGIAKENLSHLFEPFYTTSPTGKGTGLGLSMSKKIVSEHHGDIRVASEAGKGTTFTIELLQADAGKTTR